MLNVQHIILVLNELWIVSFYFNQFCVFVMVIAGYSIIPKYVGIATSVLRFILIIMDKFIIIILFFELIFFKLWNVLVIKY